MLIWCRRRPSKVCAATESAGDPESCVQIPVRLAGLRCGLGVRACESEIEALDANQEQFQLLPADRSLRWQCRSAFRDQDYFGDDAAGQSHTKPRADGRQSWQEMGL